MIVGVTGHRFTDNLELPDTLYWELKNKPEWFIELRRQLSEWFDYYRDDIDYVLNGLALGFDQTIADICICKEIPYKAYIPFPHQDEKWQVYDKMMYSDYYLDNAIQTITFGDYYSNKLYHVRNSHIVLDCDILLTYYDEDNKYASGTGSTVRKAKKAGNKIINFYKNS